MLRLWGSSKHSDPWNSWFKRVKANRREENMIKIAICDDEELFRSEMEKFVSVYGNESDTEIEIDTYEKCTSQMVKEIHDNGKRYDILFTDIEMPGLDGMEGVMALVKWEKQRKSVLSQVTGHTH